MLYIFILHFLESLSLSGDLPILDMHPTLDDPEIDPSLFLSTELVEKDTMVLEIIIMPRKQKKSKTGKHTG